MNDQEALYMAYNAFGWRNGRKDQIDKQAPWKTIYLALMVNRGMQALTSYDNNDTQLCD